MSEFLTAVIRDPEVLISALDEKPIDFNNMVMLEFI